MKWNKKTLSRHITNLLVYSDISREECCKRALKIAKKNNIDWKDDDITLFVWGMYSLLHREGYVLESSSP